MDIYEIQIQMGKRELNALLNLSSWCLVMVERLFLAMPHGCLQFVIVVCPDHTHLLFFYGRPWPAVYINFVLKIHQIQVLTEPLCRAQASFYALPNNERGTKYRGLTYSARQNCP